MNKLNYFLIFISIFDFFLLYLFINKKMSIIYLLCVILIGLWLWSLIRSFNHNKFFHFILQLLLGVFVLIPILTFIMRRSNRMRVGSQRGYIPVASTRSKGAADIYRQAQGDRRGFITEPPF